jgi:hypothetical protein
MRSLKNPPPSGGGEYQVIRIHNTCGSQQTNRSVSVPRPFVQGQIDDFADLRHGEP